MVYFGTYEIHPELLALALNQVQAMDYTDLES